MNDKKLSITAFAGETLISEIFVKYTYIENKQYNVLAKGIERVIQELQYKNKSNEKIHIKCDIIESQ